MFLLLCLKCKPTLMLSLSLLVKQLPVQTQGDRFLLERSGGRIIYRERAVLANCHSPCCQSLDPTQRRISQRQKQPRGVEVTSLMGVQKDDYPTLGMGSKQVFRWLKRTHKCYYAKDTSLPVLLLFCF